MLHSFRLPKSKLFLIAEYNKSVASLGAMMPANEQDNEEHKEDDHSYFKYIVPADLSNAALEAGITLIKELIALKKALLKYPNTEETTAFFQQTFYFAQHLFNKAKEDMNAYQLTPAHAQLLAFNNTLEMATTLINEPSVNHGKELKKSIKALRTAIKKDLSPITHRFFYAFAGSLAIFLGLSVCASTVALLLASPLTLTAVGTVASVILGGISGTLISTGIQLLRMAFAPQPQQTPQELALITCGNNATKALKKLTLHPMTLFASQPSPVHNTNGSLIPLRTYRVMSSAS